MSLLPGGLEQAFLLAAGELGLCSAAWLFVEEVAAMDAGGTELLVALRDELGRTYPVLDTVVAARLNGARGPDTSPGQVGEACRGAEQIVVVGTEALFLDALVASLPGTPFALVPDGHFEADWERVVANYDGRVELTDLDDFQRFAGPRSVLMTFVYGLAGDFTFVMPAWARAYGWDIRTQFRCLLGWDVLHRPPYVYPRWLVEVPSGYFTHLITAPDSYAHSPRHERLPARS